MNMFISARVSTTLLNRVVVDLKLDATVLILSYETYVHT